MNKLFHATFFSYLPDILQYGLGARQHKNWSDSENGAVYLTNAQEVACSFCEAAEETPIEVYNSGIVILEVDVHGLDLRPDPNISEDIEGRAVLYMLHRGIIPADRVQVIAWEATT